MNPPFFRVPAKIIWFSALFMGILASIPKILQIHITWVELLVDASIAFLFSVMLWFFNIYNLPKYSTDHSDRRFFSLGLLSSLCLGAVLMLALVSIHQFLFPKYGFGGMISMYEFRGVLINLTIYMFLHLLYESHHNKVIAIELEKVKIAHLNAQYALLKQQVNPHFLFNSLNTLKSMIEFGDHHSVQFILKLSDFYRHTLESRRQDVIPLVEEQRILQSYIYLLKARFEEGIEIEDSIGEAYSQSYIPPFTLQLLIENCIKHNVISLDYPLYIKLYVLDDYLIVENKLKPKINAEASTQLGLVNINQRYLHLVGKEIVVKRNVSNFKVKLPVIHEYNHY